MSKTRIGRPVHASVLADLTADQLRALNDVRDDIAEGLIGDGDIFMESVYSPREGKIDDMDQVFTPGCGTAACIGGYMGMKMGMTVRETARWLSGVPYGFMSLTHPWKAHSMGININDPVIVLRAMDTYIETGEAVWE